MQREVPTSGKKGARERLVVLKIEPLNAKRSSHIREEESKGKASCPEKGPKVTNLCVATDGSWRMNLGRVFNCLSVRVEMVCCVTG
jgi:hypothetical protein